MGDQKVSILVYAVDLILCAENMKTAQRTLSMLIDKIEKRGLAVNPKKCSALTAGIVSSKKKLFISLLLRSPYMVGQSPSV